MTPHDKRVAVAKWAGCEKFKPLRYATRAGKLLDYGIIGVRLMFCEGGTNGYEDWCDVPDYLNDLNAIKKLRARLTKRQRESFAHYLAYREVLRDEDYIGYIELPALDTFNLIDASAETQAEALGIILGLWK